MKINKRGKPALQESEKRTNKVLVAFNYEEYERLLSIMDDKGFDSPAVFLRSSGLRCELPPKVVLAANRVELYKLISSSIKALNLAIEQDYRRQSINIVREYLVNIANTLLSVEDVNGSKQ